jgi:tetratricopeptide (TPR) repeat protein
LTTTHGDFALATLLPQGRFNEAVKLLEAARTADPLSLDVRRLLALAQVDAGRYDDAIANCRWVLERDPRFPFVNLWLGRALGFAGRPDEALRVLEPVGGAYLGYLYAVTGRRAAAEAIATKIQNNPGGQAVIYAGLGDKDRAFAAPERARAANSHRAAMFLQRRELVPLRDDARFAALKRTIGLPD